MPLYNSTKDIKKNKLFAGVKDSLLSSFYDPKEIKEVREGEMIYRNGEASNAIYLIINGEVRVKYTNNNFVSNKIYNDFFGEKEVIDGTKRISSALAYSRLTYYKLDKKILDRLISKDTLVEENLKKFGQTELPESPADIDRKINILNRDKPLTFKLFSNKKDSEESNKKEKEPPSVMTQQILPDLDSIDDSFDEADIIIDDSEGTEEIPELEEAIVERNEMLEPIFENTETPEKEEEKEEVVLRDEEELELIEDENNDESIEVTEDVKKVEATNFVDESEEAELPDLVEVPEKEELPDLAEVPEKEEPIIEDSTPPNNISEQQVESGINREIIRKVYQCLNRIYSGVNLSELITNTKRAIKDLINSDSVELILVEEKNSTMQKMLTKDGKTTTDVFNLTDGLTGACATQKRALNYDRPTEDDRFNSKIDQPGNAGLKRILYFPVINDAGETVAVIQGARENKKFSEDEISYLTMISKQLDTAISRATILEIHIEEEKLNVAQKLREIITQEINGPIEIIDSYTKIMSQKKLPSDTDDIIRMLQKQASSVVEITDTIFKLFSKEITLESNEIHFNEFIDDVLELLSEYCETKDTKLYKKIGEGAVINIDRAKLYTAIFQLIKASVSDAKKSGKIYFSTELLDNNVVITIQNEGSGNIINPSGDTFDVIYQKENLGKNDVGLLLAKKLISVHNGEITLESVKGVGCTFRITLPAIKT